MNQKERMLFAARGQQADRIAFAPRIDIWFHANKERGTLPEKYKDAQSADEIALGEGWALHKVVLEFMEHGEDAIIDRVLGIYRVPTQGFVTRLPADVERRVEKRGDEYHVQYVTPVGTAGGCFVCTENMRQSGISMPWIKEHIIKGAADYAIVGYLFENMRVEPAYEAYRQWAEAIGDNGLPVLYGLSAGSPMHHIMKILLDSTDFYYRHRDEGKQMTGLAGQIGVYFRKVFDVIAQSPADVVLVGANFDDMLTYPPFFERHILPWLREASGKLHAANKLMLCHTDGENHGLMELLHASGMDIAEAVCPFPMTKVTLAEYYRQWSDRLTILGGIPSNLLLKETTSDAQFEKFLEELFPSISPGSRFILGVADTTPPDASFERLQRIEEAVSRRGRLPLAEHRPQPPLALSPRTDRIEAASTAALKSAPASPTPGSLTPPCCQEIRSAVISGDSDSAVRLVREAMEQGADPGQLLKECLLAPMDIIGEQFTDGTVFIPEVLLSARALNEAMAVLEPALAKQGAGREESPLVLIGTVKGDMHDIGKNLVGIMIRSVGFRVRDLGVNVSAKTFVDAVAAEKPAILALSALLTTTMPEFRTVIEGIERAGLRESVKIIVGGAPITEQYAMSVGADAYGSDGGQAAAKAKQLCGKA